MPNTQQNRMEDVSIAYVMALCAQNGYTLQSVSRDNDGIDVKIICNDYPADDCRNLSPECNVQLKSTYSKFTQLANGDFSFSLPVKNYNKLISENRLVPAILVVLHMNRDENDWVVHYNDRLEIKKCAYWVNLKGFPPTKNKDSINVTIPHGNVFSCDELKEIMTKIARGEEL